MPDPLPARGSYILLRCATEDVNKILTAVKKADTIYGGTGVVTHHPYSGGLKLSAGSHYVEAHNLFESVREAKE